MSLDNIKNAIYFNLEELFASAAVENLTGDTKGYGAKLKKIAAVAEILDLETEITTVTLNLKGSD
jgi:hypothetical protein